MDDPIVIVGAGHAGAQAAIALRQRQYTGRILLLGDEPDAPYERPPLSKEYLAGERPLERLALRSPSFWASKDIALMPGRRVVAVDPAARRLTLADGDSIPYGRLIWAAGGAPRRLTCPGADLFGIHVIRTRADVDGLRGDLHAARHVLIVGGGYIGLEAAAVLVKLGHAVTLVEAQDRLLARVAAPDLSRLLAERHRAAGIDLRLGVTVAGLSGIDGRVALAHLSDGTDLPVDLAIVGIGIVPVVGPLRDAGAEGSNGVDVDSDCRTSLPGILAIGDCAARVNPFADGRRLRVESVQNAMEQAMLAACALTGHPPPPATVPTFWSNQYELKIQTAGLSLGHHATEMRRTADGQGTVLTYLRGGRIIAADCVNAPRDFMALKSAIIG
ncbi:NAD(P)/FAD-dependent oxidoreductase [Niveispirillum sp. KHB5.9]|uniref:NAD(P)/FAD-dependent oxidoreductase n=1 Tax=Niveispirillum sp. KHB5.9 TaxID=3400269 RepID=UPI003A87AC01